MLGDDRHAVCDKVCGVETDTELSDHGDIGTCGEGLHELLGARAGNGTEVVDEVGLGHANTGILDGEGLGLLVGNDVDAQVFAAVELAGVGQRLVPDLVEGI